MNPVQMTPAPPVFTEAPVTEAFPFNPQPVPDTEYEFVQLPTGEIRAIPKSAIRQASVTATQDGPAKVAAEPEPEEEFYVHLADGQVLRVKKSDTPIGAGTNAFFGHWQIGNKVFVVTGIFPVEVEVKE